VIGYFPFTHSFGSARTAYHQLDPGSSIASDDIAPLISLANQCERVALLRSLKLVLQSNLFEVRAVGHQTLLSATFKKML
jgi:hypothetical protein